MGKAWEKEMAIREKHKNPLNEARKKDMTPEELELLQREFEKRKKTDVIFGWWFFLGGLGAHRFYLGHYGYGAAMLVQTLTLGILTGGVTTLVWVIIDLFLMWKARREVNHRIESEIIDKILAYRTAAKQA